MKDFNDMISKDNQNLTDVKKTIEDQIVPAQKTEKTVVDEKYDFLLENNTKQQVTREFKNTSIGLSTGYQIGIIEDLKIPGGGISIIAASTGHGKTTMLINTILNILEHKNDISAYFFTYEESVAPIISKFLNCYIGEEISADNRNSIESFYREGSFQYIKDNYIETFMKKEKEFFKTFIDNGRLKVFYSNTTTDELVKQIRFLKKNTNIGVVGIDYMQLLKMPTGNTQAKRQEQLKEICIQLKDCAVETGLPIIIAAQFNRQVTMESEMSPISIREAGDIEQIAQLMLGVWNRNKACFNKAGNIGRDNNEKDLEPTMCVEILKNRKGVDGQITILDFNGNTAKITNQSKNPNSGYTNMASQNEKKGRGEYDAMAGEN